MSNPTEMEVPGVPSWMQEETNTNTNTAATSTTAASNDAMPSWTATPDLETPPAVHVPVEEHAVQPLEIVPADSSNDANTSADDNNGSAAAAAASKTWNQYFMESFRRDGRLLLIVLLIIILMNIPFVKWALYPFTIFSTWIHELCHGLAAVFCGGRISKLLIFPDGSGLAYTAVPANRRGFVSSAGYQGTAVIGCLLLIFRRTKRGPRSGTMAVAIMMILSCLLWIRNVFGFCFIFGEGLILGAVAWKVPSTHMRNVYVGLAATCSMNAITSVNNLFGSNHVVNGAPQSTDAHTMAELNGGNYWVWAVLWLALALVLTVMGILFAIPGPDEVADFTCCGVCQDFGLFRMCNYPGQRLTSRIRSSMRGSSSEGGESTNEEPTSGP